MTDLIYLRFLTVAAAVFVAGLPITQWAHLRAVRRRARDPVLLEACSVREHVLRALAPSALPGLVLAALGFVLWLVLHRPLGGWNWILGGEILLAFVVLELGLSLLTLRFVLGTSADGVSPRRTAAVRIVVLVAGWLYGLAVWMLRPGNAGETLLAVLILGVGLGVLGLNRMGSTPREALARLGQW